MIMKRVLIPCLIALFSIGAAGASWAQSTTQTFSTQETPIGDLLDNPGTKAVLEKIVPEFIKAERIDDARGMTLREIQPYAADMFTEEVLAKIDAELAKVPPAAQAAK
jgi:hypothetical protein